MADMSNAVAQFFKALGDGLSADEIASAAREALRELAAQRVKLKRQSELIQQCAEEYGGVPIVDLAEDADGGLSDEQKAAINQLLDETLATQPATSVDEMIALVMAKTAIPLAELVEKPPSVISSMMAHARKRLDRAAASNGATAATPQPVAPAA